MLKVTGINQQPGVSVNVTLNAKTYVATVTGQIIDQDVSGYVGPYTNLKMEGKGTIDACNNALKLDIAWTVSQGSFGSGPFIIKK